MSPMTHWVVETKDGPALVIVAHIAGILPLVRRATILLASGRAIDVEHTFDELLTKWNLTRLNA